MEVTLANVLTIVGKGKKVRRYRPELFRKPVSAR